MTTEHDDRSELAARMTRGQTQGSAGPGECRLCGEESPVSPCAACRAASLRDEERELRKRLAELDAGAGSCRGGEEIRR